MLLDSFYLRKVTKTHYYFQKTEIVIFNTQFSEILVSPRFKN